MEHNVRQAPNATTLSVCLVFPKHAGNFFFLKKKENLIFYALAIYSCSSVQFFSSSSNSCGK
jgi:hypothetical protein